VSNALHEAVVLYDQQQHDSEHSRQATQLLPAVLQQNELSWGSDWMLPEPEQLQDVEVVVAVDEPDWNCIQSTEDH
jgi:hypothetical protein